MYFFLSRVRSVKGNPNCMCISPGKKAFKDKDVCPKGFIAEGISAPSGPQAYSARAVVSS